MSGDSEGFKRQLQSMIDQLASMIGIADDHEDHLLGALLSEVHAYIERRYAELQSR